MSKPVVGRANMDSGNPKTYVNGTRKATVGVGIVIAHNHRVAGGSRPPPAPTERSVRISRTTLFESCFAARRELVTPDRGDTALVATEGTVP